MRITELLNKDAMDLNATPKSKAEAIDLLVDLMVRSGNILDKEEYYCAHGIRYRRARRLKAFKIVLSFYYLGGSDHGVHIQRHPYMSRHIPVDRTRMSRIAYRIAVMLAFCVLSDMEICRDLSRAFYTYIRRQYIVHHVAHFLRRYRCFYVTVRHLPQGVNPCVRPPCARHVYAFSRYAGQSILDDLLNSNSVFLTLPARICRSVVFNLKKYSHK